MKYPAQFIKEEKDSDYHTVIFRDFPEAITCGDTFEEAYDMAVDLLLMVLSDYFKDSKCFPEPSTAEDGDIMVSIPTTVFRE